MTRIIKWQDYRNEIAQSSFIGSFIYNQQNRINSYENEINKINPSILQNINNKSRDIIQNVSEIDLSSNQISNDICSLFNNINEINSDSNTNLFVALKNLENECIIDKNFYIKQNYLDKDKNYSDFEKFISNKKIISINANNINENLQSKYESLTKTKSDAKVSPLKLLDLNSKNSKRYLFKSLFIISSALICISMILFIIKVTI